MYRNRLSAEPCAKPPPRRDSNGEKTDDQNWNLQDLRDQLLGGDKGSAECLALWCRGLPVSSR
jgi:hypothetical protein